MSYSCSDFFSDVVERAQELGAAIPQAADAEPVEFAEAVNANMQRLADERRELLDALGKATAALGQLCERPQDAREIAVQGYVGHAYAVARRIIGKVQA